MNSKSKTIPCNDTYPLPSLYKGNYKKFPPSQKPFLNQWAGQHQRRKPHKLRTPKNTIKYLRPLRIWCFSNVHLLTFLYFSYLPWHLSVPSRKTARYLAPIGRKVGVSLTRTGTLYPIIERNKGAIET